MPFYPHWFQVPQILFFRLAMSKVESNQVYCRALRTSGVSIDGNNMVANDALNAHIEYKLFDSRNQNQGTIRTSLVYQGRDD